MDGILKQSTAVTIKIGPFVDDTDGKTAETGLTISQADVRLSKNGGDVAQKNESTTCSGDEIGLYNCMLDTADTDTLGLLRVDVQESGALPVWHTFLVFSSNVYDSLVGATDKLQVDIEEVDGDATAAANLNSACDNYSATRGLAGTALPAAVADAAGGLVISDAGGLDIDSMDNMVTAILADTAEIGAAGVGLTEAGGDGDHLTEAGGNGDHLTEAGGTGDHLSAVPWNSSWDAQVESEVDDALGGGTGTALTAIPWNSDWDAEVQSEVNDALVALNLDHLVAVADSDDVADNSIIGKLASTDGDWSNFAASTDSLQSIRDYTAEGIPKSTAKNNIPVLMVDSTDHVTPKTGLTVTAQVSKDAAAFASASGSVAEISNGWYQFDAAAGDMSGDILIFRFTATGADATQITFFTSS